MYIISTLKPLSRVLVYMYVYIYVYMYKEVTCIYV